MPRCGCAGSSCTCLVTGGTGIDVEGAGTADNPYVITATGDADISGTVQFIDTDTVNFTVTGDGTLANPYQVRADVTLSLDDLTDVDTSTTPPTQDYVLAWNGSAWVPAPPNTTDPGAISTAAPVTGDGTASNPIGLDLVTQVPLQGTGVTGDPLTVDIVTDLSLVGDGTSGSPLQAAIRYAMGTTQVTGISEGNPKSVSVTFPTGRFQSIPFITLGMYTSNPGLRYVSHINKTQTGMTLVGSYSGASATAEIWITWVAIQQSPAVGGLSSELPLAAFAAPALAGDVDPTPAADTMATCHTNGCQNQDVPIPLTLSYIDEETGATMRVEGVQCGACGQPINDLVAVS